MNCKLVRLVRFLAIFPVALTWEIVDRLLEWWNFGPLFVSSQYILRAARARERLIMEFINCKKPIVGHWRKHETTDETRS